MMTATSPESNVTHSREWARWAAGFLRLSGIGLSRVEASRLARVDHWMEAHRGDEGLPEHERDILVYLMRTAGARNRARPHR